MELLSSQVLSSVEKGLHFWRTDGRSCTKWLKAEFNIPDTLTSSSPRKWKAEN